LVVFCKPPPRAHPDRTQRYGYVSCDAKRSTGGSISRLAISTVWSSSVLGVFWANFKFTMDAGAAKHMPGVLAVAAVVRGRG
jgi:hypothetical protein